MAMEVSGTVSTFGPQILSTKSSQPKIKFGTAGRTEKLAEKPFEFKQLGQSSKAGFSSTLQSGFGAQHNSKNTTAPSAQFSGKYDNEIESHRSAFPGPGSYQNVNAVGKQLLSGSDTAPQYKIGTGERFGQYKPEFKDEYATPAAGTWRPPSGWLGDAPQHTFHGTSKRADISNGLPGQQPTAVTDPGPGTYNATSAWGNQVVSAKHTAPRVRVGTADRDSSRKMFISKEHDKDLFGKHSPGPMYRPQVTASSKIHSTSSFKFGSGDRFSEVKPTKGRDTKGVPGPGSYVV